MSPNKKWLVFSILHHTTDFLDCFVHHIMSNKKESSSSTMMIAAGVAVAVAAGAAYYAMSAATEKSTKPEKGKKKKSKKSKKKKEDKSTKSAAPAATPAAAPAPTAARENPETPTATTATTESSPVVTPADASSGLQTSGIITQETILKFFEASNALLSQQEVKDNLAAAYQRGENISELLKAKQESVWSSLNVEAQFGFQTIQATLSNPATMTLAIRDSLVKAATMENSILTYALLGSQEAFEAEQSKLQRLSEEAQGELNRELQVAHGQGETAMGAYSQTILTGFREATAGFEGLDEIGQLKKRQELSDEQYKSIVKGQCLQQLMMQQQQQQGGFGGQ